MVVRFAAYFRAKAARQSGGLWSTAVPRHHAFRARGDSRPRSEERYMWLPNRQKWLILAALFALALFFYRDATEAILAVRLMLGIQRVASGDTGQNLAVQESRIRRSDGTRTLEALIYRPARGTPRAGIVLVPGVSELGCFHPRLQALSRNLASAGFLVLTPDIVAFRQFEIPPAAMDEIAFWFGRLETLDGAPASLRSGLAGISFSATLALITAARKELRDKVAFVFGIGAYDDPLRCSQAWFAAGPEPREYFPTRFYAKWVVMLAALDMIRDAKDREFLDSVLRALLLQKAPPPEQAGMTAEGRRWYRLAVMSAGDTDVELSHAIEGKVTPRLYAPITPDRAAAEVRCPVFLVHGAHDDLIPPSESVRLRERIGTARASLLISPFLTHTHPFDRKMGWKDTASAVIDTFVFLRGFARAIR
jgi:dienelactone hydrolase